MSLQKSFAQAAINVGGAEPLHMHKLLRVRALLVAVAVDRSVASSRSRGGRERCRIARCAEPHPVG